MQDVSEIIRSDRRFGGIDPEESEYDQDLGRKMGEDARKVAAGEMSRTEFYERYHDAVVGEFGEDERPAGTEGGGDE